MSEIDKQALLKIAQVFWELNRDNAERSPIKAFYRLTRSNHVGTGI
jgi:hypothetical protein